MLYDLNILGQKSQQKSDPSKMILIIIGYSDRINLNLIR